MYLQNDKKDLKKFVKMLMKDLRSDDPQTRQAAAFQFDFESVPINVDSDGKPLDQNKIDTFNRISREIAMDVIIEGLNDEDIKVRRSLARFLGTLRDQRGLERLKESLKTEKDPGVRSAFINSIFQLTDYSLDCLLKGLESDMDIKKRSVYFLGEKHPQKAINPLINLLNDPNWQIRFSAIEALGKSGNEKALEPLSKCLKDKSASVRRKSIESIGKIIENNSVKLTSNVLSALMDSLEDENLNVKLATVKTLETIDCDKINKEKINKCLENLINDSNSSISNKAKEIFGNRNKKGNVPEWDEKFYKKWLSNLNKSKFLDIEGNLSYIFNYLYEVITEFVQSRDINQFLESFNKVDEGYSKYPKIKEYLIIWKSDAYLLVGEYGKALETVKEKGLLSFEATKFAQILSNEEGNFIDGKNLIYMGGISNLTDFGRKHQNEVADVCKLFLNDFYEENGMNMAQFFLENFNTDLSEEGLHSLERFFPKKSEYLRLKGNGFSKEFLINHTPYSHGLFRGAPVIIDSNSINFKYSFIPPIVAAAFKNEIKRIIRESENTVREEMDIPKIGEGWVSETELYYLVRKAFPKEYIIHHGRPSWLGRQHLDIYFPEKNIGIEYQGIQHDQPVDLFGGQKALKYRQKLDNRKKERCKKNKCDLIYVYPNYDFKEIKTQIRKSLSHLIN